MEGGDVRAGVKGVCVGGGLFCFCCFVFQIQTHERFKGMLFIRTKHNMPIFGVTHFIKLQNDT